MHAFSRATASEIRRAAASCDRLRPGLLLVCTLDFLLSESDQLGLQRGASSLKDAAMCVRVSFNLKLRQVAPAFKCSSLGGFSVSSSSSPGPGPPRNADSNRGVRVRALSVRPPSPCQPDSEWQAPLSEAQVAGRYQWQYQRQRQRRSGPVAAAATGLAEWVRVPLSAHAPAALVCTLGLCTGSNYYTCARSSPVE